MIHAEFVNQDNNHKKWYLMVLKDTGDSIACYYGRITPGFSGYKTVSYDRDKWNRTFSDKVRKGYTTVDSQEFVDLAGGFNSLDPHLQRIFIEINPQFSPSASLAQASSVPSAPSPVAAALVVSPALPSLSPWSYKGSALF